MPVSTKVDDLIARLHAATTQLEQLKLKSTAVTYGSTPTDAVGDRTETEAYVIEAAGQPAVLKTIPLKPLRDDQVEVDMKFCGLCNTDCGMNHNKWGISDYPMVAGHEGTGIVVRVGSKVTDFKVGDHVGVGWIRDSCGSCRHCVAGRDNLCEKGYKGTYLGKSATLWGEEGNELGGCFAKVVRINAKFAAKIPSNLALDAAAPLMCAGITIW
ncbi:hypothetical protein HDU91_006056 [Kappamyces sp. JEL0680]|nr:hypothetical protein HDU91_006056 [Kappamyces sp. JEL0680]